MTALENFKSLPFVGILAAAVLWVAFAQLNKLTSADKTGGCCETNTCGTAGDDTVKNVVLIMAIVASLFQVWKVYDLSVNGPSSLNMRQRISRKLKKGGFADRTFDKMTLPGGRGQSAPKISGRGNLMFGM